jgi:AcrR family transcriptional regulator
MKMNETRVDRRVQRTRRLLQDALLALILEKGYAAITVQDILDRANLGRSTFYVHYRDKDDLLVSEFEHFREMFEEYDVRMSGDKQKQTGPAPSPSLAFFRHAGEQHRLYKAMVGKQGGEVVQKYLYQYVSDLMKNHLNRQIAQTRQLTVPREILVHYMVSSFLALLTWWLDHDMPYTAERMEEIFNTLTVSGFKSALGSKE